MSSCKHHWNYTRFGNTDVRICKDCSKMEVKEPSGWVEKVLKDFVNMGKQNENQMR